MDGVLADFEAGIKRYCSIDDADKFDNWEGRSKIVDKICEQNKDIFDDLPPIEGGIEAIMELSEKYSVYFLSTPMRSIPESYSGKRKWIDKHFGEWGSKRLILTHRKDLCIGDYLIDDRTLNGASDFTGEFIKFGSDTFPHWDSIKNYLLK